MSTLQTNRTDNNTFSGFWTYEGGKGATVFRFAKIFTMSPLPKLRVSIHFQKSCKQIK